MNPDVAATMAASANQTLWAMTYPTAVGTPDPFNLIEEAYSKGEIDIDHASVYRMYALFGNRRLPERYQSNRLIQADGLGAYAFVIKDINRESQATKRFLGMFMTPREITVVPTAVHPSATPSATFFPHGLYTIVVENTAQLGALPLAGRWRMDLTSPEEARFSFEGKLVITRLYQTVGNQMEFSDEFGSYACDDQETWSSYSWSLRDERAGLRQS